MAEPSSKLLFNVTVFIYLLKLFIVCVELSTPIQILVNQDYSFWEFIWLIFIEQSLVLEPLLIGIGIIGLLKKDGVGFLVSLIYPYFILSFGILTVASYSSPIGHFDWTFLIFIILLLTLLNFNIYKLKAQLNNKNQMNMNLTSFGIGIFLFLFISELLK